MFFSVVIPVRSINDYLIENISFLKKLTFADFEVIIVLDNGEKYDFEDDMRFRLIFAGAKSPGEKRNVGAREAKGDILAFLDDDAYPKSDWLDRAGEIFEDNTVYALGAPAVTPLNAEFLEKCSGRVLESFLTGGGTTYRHIPMKARAVNDYPTVNLFVRKEAFFKVGGFIHEFWPGEDTKLCLDLVNKFGRNFLYDPNPIVYHHRRGLFIPHLKQISRYGQHRGQFARIFPSTSRRPSYFVPSLFIVGLLMGPFAIVLFPFLAPIYFGVLSLYVLLLFIEITRVYFKDQNIKESLYVGVGILLTHFIYGINFIVGFMKRPKLQLRGIDLETGSYLGG